MKLPTLDQTLKTARSEISLVAAIAVLGAGVAAFLHLVDEVIWEGEGHAFDQAVLEALRAGGDPNRPIGLDWLPEAARDVTSLGSASVLTLMVIAVLGFIVLKRRLSLALLVLGAAVGGAAISQLLKQVFQRERPPLPYRAAEALNPSFPSGHAMLSAVIYLTLGVLLASALPERRLKAYVVAVAVCLTVLVGATRVYLGVHWLTDVLAGWSVGAAWAMACWLGVKAWERSTGKSAETPKPR